MTVGIELHLIRPVIPCLNYAENSVSACSDGIIDLIKLPGSQSDFTLGRFNPLKKNTVAFRNCHVSECSRLDNHLIDGGIDLNFIMGHHV